MSSQPAFVHLRVHTEFSVVDGIVRIPDLVGRVVEHGQPAVAVTDLGNLFGLIRFYKAARGKGVKPIAGCDVWVEGEGDTAFRLLLLVKDRQGYLNLCELLSRAYLTNQRRGRAEIRREWLVELSEGLIALSGARAGDVGQALAAGNVTAACVAAETWAAIFPGAFYIELQRSGMEGDETYVRGAVAVAQRTGLPVVATHPVQFIERDEFRAHEARVCIAEGELLANPKRVRRFSEEQYLLSSQEMAERFADVPSALANTVEIARRCNLTLELGKPRLPDFPTPDGMPLSDYLIQLAEEGLAVRMEQLFPDPAERAANHETYYARLRLECDTIIKMGFPGYFLIVADFINWGKNNGVPVGPGRGSGAGSLVAFSLGITDLDPIRYDLLFERFLNPERVSMPDFDIDFCQDNRDRVIEYVKEKYGRDAVSQIATFGTLGAKAVVRDAGRVLDMPYLFCDGLSKLIPHNPADPWSLDRALAEEPAFRERYEQEEEAKALIDLAKPLEGLTRNVGMHAGGVLIAPGKLTDFCPLYCQPGQQSSAVSQYDKDDVEAVGLVKFDFLGLRNLTILEWAVRYVREFNPQRADFDLMKLALDDPASYKLLSDGNTTSVFQLESRGMKELLKKLKPSNFEDIIAVLALYRPGPLGSGMVDDFVNRKHGRARAEYFHDDLEPVLKSTYGVIVYQEQVMLISQIIGGYTLGGADMLRRAMGKKKPEEMAKHREIFEKGALEKGYDPALAVTLFDLMEKFAEYGFNKSHTAAYALIAYHTAWLKAHHPAEFMAATLSSDMDDTDKVQIFWNDTLANGVKVLPPDVNESEYRFAPVQDEHTARGRPPRTIRYGLGAVKGTGQAAVEEILRVRRSGPYTDLFDFCRRVDRHIVNRRTIEALIRAGAFDSLQPNRAALFATLGSAIDAAEQAERAASQVSLFGDGDLAESLHHELAQVAPWDLRDQLTQEKTALGFYFSGHLFDAYAGEARRISPTPLARLQPSREPQWMAGILTDMRVQMTRRGKMVFAVLDDGTAQLEISVFNELYEMNRGKLKSDQLLIVQGKVSHDEYSGGMRIVAEALHDLQMARESRARALRIALNGNADAVRLREMLNPYRAEPENGMPGTPVEVCYASDTAACTVRLGVDWRVRVPDTLIEQLVQWAGAPGVSLEY
ncbi:DNA polymerase III subunit alpha [Verticiella sediminum]|uniref:DNA polymerase III subunit alpha n=1 Tax=Verticiella sediminum TaxID=1247510 RepID=A0A556AZ01_9BURK|nr:DNA polymerase III subunit alpha [Verticiella sediminum]TSH98161.1 DNA polymerase III subunit alpha [Verticiella sediminum]